MAKHIINTELNLLSGSVVASFILTLYLCFVVLNPCFRDAATYLMYHRLVDSASREPSGNCSRDVSLRERQKGEKTRKRWESGVGSLGLPSAPFPGNISRPV